MPHRLMEAEGSANFSCTPSRCGQVTKPAPSRSRGTTEDVPALGPGLPMPHRRTFAAALRAFRSLESRLRFAIHGSAGRLRRLTGHGHPLPEHRSGSVMEAEGSANFSSAPSRCGQVTKPAPSRSRCAPEVECARDPSRSRSSTKTASSGHASAREPQPLAAVAAAGYPLQPRGVGQIPYHRLLDP